METPQPNNENHSQQERPKNHWAREDWEKAAEACSLEGFDLRKALEEPMWQFVFGVSKNPFESTDENNAESESK